MNYEVWYSNSNNSYANERKLAEFSFLFEAEKYIKIFHPNEVHKFYIVKKEDGSISFAY